MLTVQMIGAICVLWALNFLKSGIFKMKVFLLFDKVIVHYFKE